MSNVTVQIACLLYFPCTYKPAQKNMFFIVGVIKCTEGNKFCISYTCDLCLENVVEWHSNGPNSWVKVLAITE